MKNLHEIQIQILRKLLFNPDIRYTNLKPTQEMENNKLNFHLKQLSNFGYIEKRNDGYALTILGKQYAGGLDTDRLEIEKQPKISVLIIPKKIIKKVPHYIVQRRLKEPYFGYHGFMTGKIRFGETVEQAARREFKEETGMDAENYKHFYIIHEMVYDKSGKQLEDKFFNVVELTGITGEIVNGEGSSNEWYTEEQYLVLEPKFHNENDMYFWYKGKDYKFKEFKYYIEGF